MTKTARTAPPPPKERPRWTIFGWYPEWLAWDVLSFLAVPLYIAIMAGAGRQVAVPLRSERHALWSLALGAGLVLYVVREVVARVNTWREGRR
jgi:hypothetical protein